MRALGVTSSKRVASAPDIPTIAEAGVPGYESLQWYGLLAPAGTPTEILARLHKESVAACAARTSSHVSRPMARKLSPGLRKSLVRFCAPRRRNGRRS
ncbi:MAG: tripartite tricarboxylate transporter substrate-binding protein [Burkholderiales bacterium]